MGGNVSVDLSELAQSFDDPLRELVRELRRGYQSIAECLEQTTAECEVRTAELADYSRQLATARQTQLEQEQEIAKRTAAQTTESHRCAALKEQLEAIHEELRQTIEKLRVVEVENAQVRQQLSDQSEQTRLFQNQADRAIAERDRAQADASQLRERLESMSASAVDAATLRGQLTAVQDELQRLRDHAATDNQTSQLVSELEAMRSERQQFEATLTELVERWASAAPAAPDTSELSSQLTVLQAQLSDWSERAAAGISDEPSSEQLAEVRAERQQVLESLTRCEEQLGGLSESQSSIAQLRSQFESVQEALLRPQRPAASEVEEELRNQLAASRAEHQQLEGNLAQLGELLASLTETAVGAAELRGQLTAAQEEVSRLRDQTQQPVVVPTESSEVETSLAKLHEQVVALADVTMDAGELRGELSAVREALAKSRAEASDSAACIQLQGELAAANSERQQLESELDLIRQRAAELGEALDQQRHAMGQERQQWSEELRHLRRAVEQQSEVLVRRARRATNPGDDEQSAESGHVAADPIVDTLKEQFEALQRNKQRDAKTSPR
jgi:chromosome segregation ATPase